jgi:hypothetical protein
MFLAFTFPKWFAFIRMLWIDCQLHPILSFLVKPLSLWALNLCAVYGIGLIVFSLFLLGDHIHSGFMILSSSWCRGWVIGARIWCDTTEYIYNCNFFAHARWLFFIYFITAYTHKLVFCTCWATSVVCGTCFLSINI